MCPIHFRFPIPFAFKICNLASQLLIVINSSINFIIYCCVSKRFRKELKRLLSTAYQKCFKRNETQPIETQLTTNIDQPE